MIGISWRAFLVGLVLAGLTACNTAERRERQANEARLVEIYTQLAVEQLNQNKLDLALKEIRKALDINSRDGRANLVMGLIQARIRDDGKAEYYFNRAIESDPSNSEARNTFGVFLCERDRAEEAMKQFDAAIANPLYRTPERAQLNAGVCLVLKSMPAEAEKYFRAALKTNSRSSIALYNMAKISFDQGEILSARGFIQRYFEVSPDSPDALLLAVKIERALKAKDAEASYALRLRGKFPDSPEAKELRALSGR